MGGNNLDSSWLVCVGRPWSPVLYLHGHAARERPVVLQHQGKKAFNHTIPNQQFPQSFVDVIHGVMFLLSSGPKMQTQRL